MAIFTVGVTGGMGSGKSTVMRLLSERPRVTTSLMDDVSKALLETNAELRASLVQRFGDSLFTGAKPQCDDGRGSLDRGAFAAILFGPGAEPDAVQVANSIIHPAVWKEAKRLAASAAREGSQFFIIESALAFSSGAAKNNDLNVLISVPQDERVARCLERGDGGGEAEVRARMARQTNWAALEAGAAEQTPPLVILHNSGNSTEELEAKIASLYEDLVRRAEEKGGQAALRD